MKHDTTETNDVSLQEIDVDAIKFFVRRSRSPGAYSRLKDSIKELGLKQPIHVKDISDWPRSDRRRPDGGEYHYELICGQGRLQAFRDLRFSRIPAIIIDVPETEIVGRFLAENVMRKKLSWYEKAQLVKRDVDAGMRIEAIKEKYFVTTGQVYKYLRILRQASGKLLSQSDIEKLSMNQAEELTSVDAETQEIVVDVLKEEQLDASQIKPLVRKAKQLRQSGNLSKSALKASLRHLQKSLLEIHNRLKLKRLHWTLGPYKLRRLLEQSPELKNVLEEEGVDFSDFLRATSTGAE
jgi:ParB family chromosome partitioning protein